MWAAGATEKARFESQKKKKQLTEAGAEDFGKILEIDWKTRP